MGLLLRRLERHAEAAAMWRRYLELDDASPWGARARRALKYCEMQLARPKQGPLRPLFHISIGLP